MKIKDAFVRESKHNDSGKAIVKSKRSNIDLFKNSSFKKEATALSKLFKIKDKSVEHAVWNYTNVSTVNNALILLKPAKFSGKIKHQISLLRQLQKMKIGLDDRYHVYSGFGPFDPSTAIKSGIFKTPSFISASLNIDVAIKTTNFRRSESESRDDHVAHFALPKGYTGGFYIAPYSKNPEELEFLLFPNQKFKQILKKTIVLEGGGKRYIWSFVPMENIEGKLGKVELEENNLNESRYNDVVVKPHGFWILPDGSLRHCSYSPEDGKNEIHHDDIAREEFGGEKLSGIRQGVQNGWIRCSASKNKFIANAMIQCDFAKVSKIQYKVLSKWINDLNAIEEIDLYFDHPETPQYKRFDNKVKLLGFIKRQLVSQSSKKLDEVYIPPTSYGYWITDTGAIAEVGHEEHNIVAMRMLGMKANDHSSPYMVAFNKGWIRILMKRFALNADFKAETVSRKAIQTLSQLGRSVKDLPEFRVDYGWGEFDTFSSYADFNRFINKYANPDSLQEDNLLEFGAFGPQSPNNCWIKPDGDVIQLDRAGGQYHIDIVDKHFTSNKPIPTSNDTLAEAFKAGWIRVYIMAGMVNVEFRKDYTTVQAIRRLIRIIKEEDFDSIIIDYRIGPYLKLQDKAKVLQFLNIMGDDVRRKEASERAEGMSLSQSY